MFMFVHVCLREVDEFMKAIQPSAASVPWMFGPVKYDQDTAGWYKYTTFLQRFAGQQIAANQSGSYHQVQSPASFLR